MTKQAWSEGEREKVASRSSHHVNFTAVGASCMASHYAATPTCQGVIPMESGSHAPRSNWALGEEWIEETALSLSKTELAVLRCLVKNESRWLTSDTIIAASLGTAHTRDTSLVRVHVHAIRKKLGALGKHVQSRRGLGYRFLSSLQAPNMAMAVVRE